MFGLDFVEFRYEIRRKLNKSTNSVSREEKWEDEGRPMKFVRSRKAAIRIRNLSQPIQNPKHNHQKGYDSNTSFVGSN